MKGFIYIMESKTKRWNFNTITLLLVVLGIENFACLIPSQNYLIPGLIKFSDIGIILAIAWSLFVYMCTRTHKKIRYRYGHYVFILVILTIISSYMACLFFNQPIIYGIRSTRNLLVCFLLYFPITRQLQSGKLRRGDLIRIIFIVGTFELVVYTLQFLLKNVASFTYLNLTEQRLGTARIRFPYLLPLVLGMICLGNILSNKNKTPRYIIKNLVYVIWSAFLLIIVCQYRAPALILIATWIISYLLWKKNIAIKTMIAVAIAIVGIGVVFNLPLVQNAIYTLQNPGSTMDTLSIRKLGQQYYLNRLQYSKWFGFGLPNQDCHLAVEASGQGFNYYLADNGILGFAYIYGIAGIVWLALFWIKTLRCSFSLYSHERKYQYLLYFIFETGNLYIGMHWFYYYPFPFAIMLILLDYDYYVFKENEAEHEQ